MIYRKRLNLTQIKEMVEKYYELDLTSDCRDARHTKAKQIAVYLMREESYHKPIWREISAEFGKYDHQMALNSHKAASYKIDTDYKVDYEYFKDRMVIEEDLINNPIAINLDKVELNYGALNYVS